MGKSHKIWIYSICISYVYTEYMHRIYIYTHIYTNTFIYIHTYIYSGKNLWRDVLKFFCTYTLGGILSWVLKGDSLIVQFTYFSPKSILKKEQKQQMTPYQSSFFNSSYESFSKYGIVGLSFCWHCVDIISLEICEENIKFSLEKSWLALS